MPAIVVDRGLTLAERTVTMIAADGCTAAAHAADLTNEKQATDASRQSPVLSTLVERRATTARVLVGEDAEPVFRFGGHAAPADRQGRQRPAIAGGGDQAGRAPDRSGRSASSSRPRPAR